MTCTKGTQCYLYAGAVLIAVVGAIAGFYLIGKKWAPLTGLAGGVVGYLVILQQGGYISTPSGVIYNPPPSSLDITL